MRSSPRLYAALAVCAASCTCDPLAQNGTALRFRVDIDDSVNVAQLRFHALFDGGELFTPTLRPEQPGERLMSGGSLLALLPDALDGQRVTCRVEGLQDGGEVARDDSNAVVKKGFETTCTIELLATQPCNPSTCAGCCVGDICLKGDQQGACGAGAATCRICADGQRCDQGSCLCDVTSCGGCCSGNTCLDGGADFACGRSGAQCAACPVGQTCSGGACGCDGGPCGTGCNATSCAAGCCSGGACEPQADSSCGAMGAACTDCRTPLSDRCAVATGTCICGNASAACKPGQHCVSGACVCDNTVCTGCCQPDGTCLAGTSKQQCGVDGGSCRSCGGGAMCRSGVCQ